MQTQIASAPRGIFRGENFMTPIYVECRKGQLRGRTVYIEISKEREPYFSRTVAKEPDGGPTYGLTVVDATGQRLEPDPSQCVSDVRDINDVYLALSAIE